jgi:hypothetical protein
MARGKSATLAPVYVAAALIAAGVIYLLILAANVSIPALHR